MKNNNYIVVQGWMINELKLKSNDLLIYAIIYGFSQDGDTMFTGSLKYLEEASGASRSTVKNSIKKLLNNGLIKKEEYFINSIKFCKYSHVDRVGQNLTHHTKNRLGGGLKIDADSRSKITPNNIILNNNLFDNIEEEVSLDLKILNYLNEKKPGAKKFDSSKANLKHIKLRLKEKYKFEDFLKVIDFKIQEWKDSTKMRKYIRPSTLFGDNFNSYLIEASESNDISTDTGSDNFSYNPGNHELL